MKRIIKKTTDSAVVGMVTAMLLIGLIIMVLSIVQLVYVPIIMEQREAEHMDRVTEQFALLTSIIDNQAADERKGIPIASFLTLGSKELPILVSSKAYGNLEVLENSYTITIQNDSTSNSFPIGIITYSSKNMYYLDQSYSYEAGAMIVSQSQGNKMIVRPGFFINYNSTLNIVNISFDVINISSIGQKTIAAGYGICGIQTEFSDISTNIIYTDINNITIASSFSHAWYGFLNRTLMEAGLNSEATSTHFILTDMDDYIKLEFLPSITAVKIIFKIIEIKAQVGPGWVE
jgi:hypothetical protein